MAIVVNGATCSLSEAVIDKLLSWDVDVVAQESSHFERNSSLLKYSNSKLTTSGSGFTISFDDSDGDLVLGRDIIVHDLLPSRADKWLAPEIAAWVSGESYPAGPRYWLSVIDAAEAIAAIAKSGKTPDKLQMCGRREWLPKDSKAEFEMLWARTIQGYTGQFTPATLFGYSISGMEVKPISPDSSARPDLEPLHELLLEVNSDGWRPLIPFRTALMNLIAGIFENSEIHLSSGNRKG
ncbi:MAG: hypothetical protein QGI21_03955 [Candidatus Poseidoniaceae archaeon]|jgi:hypothetical protein|nr:hypothetical protein [Candidatus Poseidoniaceae archaeon]